MTAARAIVAAVVLLAGGCVTERPKPGLHYRGAPIGGGESVATPGTPTLPAGPVASPVTNSSFNSLVQVEVVPLGGIGYDGQVLPLVSPDGRFVASEEGQAPTWPTLLAQPGAAVPAATRITVYDITKRPARVVDFARPLPTGLVLGRGADDAGFLIEAPQPDGSRWIGRVRWASGELEWLVHGSRVFAHAVYTPAGSLAYIARDISSDEGSLVLRASDGTETVRSGDGSSHMFPVASSEPGIVCSLSLTAAGMELLAWSLDSDSAQAPGKPERLGSIVARALVCRGGEPALAYQIVAPSSQALPRRSGEPWQGERPAIFNPSFGRMAEFDRSVGGLALLPEHSIAAARASGAGADGWFVTTPDGLVFSPDLARKPAQPGEHRTIQNVNVLAGPLVPRQTTDPNRPLVLFGPVARDRNRLQVMALRFVGPEAEAAEH